MDYKIISHRGNLSLKFPASENSPNAIDSALDHGFDVEIDLWALPHSQNLLWLGHDEPKFYITLDFLAARQDNLWIHCKNLEAVQVCMYNNFNYFVHDTEDCTLTSKGFVWMHYTKTPLIGSIAVLPEVMKVSTEVLLKCSGMCTDYPLRYRNELRYI